MTTVRLLLLASLACFGCQSPGSGPPRPDKEPDYVIEVGSPNTDVPIWAGRELSWETLGLVADWVRSDSAGADEYWVVEGHLRLAEGRAHFSKQEAAHATDRKAAALAGFHRVLAHPGAIPTQRQRAQLGLASLDRESGSGSPTVTGALPRTAWAAGPVKVHRLTAATSPWRWITIHHSAEAGARPLSGSLADSTAAIRRIQSGHMNGPDKMGDIGYHFLIDPAGRTFQGRELRWQGAHAGGTNNVGNVGICLLGNFQTDYPSPEALEAMHGLVEVLRRQMGVQTDHVCGHLHWKATQCPGRHLLPHLERYGCKSHKH